MRRLDPAIRSFHEISMRAWIWARAQARLDARPAAHRRALWGLLAAAQAADDARLLRNAYLALSAMTAADRSLFGAPAPCAVPEGPARALRPLRGARARPACKAVNGQA